MTGENGGRRLTVLLATPFSPLVTHDHAAQELALPFFTALAKQVDLHVVAPIRSGATLREVGPIDFRLTHVHTKQRPRWRYAMSPYPLPLREEWPGEATRVVRDLVASSRPDVLHAEYLHPFEAMLEHDGFRSLTLHDVLGRSPEGWTGTPTRTVRGQFWTWQHRRMVALEENAVRSSSATFTLSEADAEVAGVIAGRETVHLTRLGIPDTGARWRGPGEHAPPTLMFAGALWRAPNEESARFLADEVLPRVQDKIPEVRLRVVGARPSQALSNHLRGRRGVDLVGFVDDLEAELERASVVCAPSMVPAGILLKAVKALQAGAPCVLNPASADPIPGVEHGAHAMIATSAEEWAESIVDVLGRPDIGRTLGELGRQLVDAHFSVDAQARRYLQVWQSGVTRA